MKIITISREFGSGGRELGKRLADSLDFAYYDKEILTAIAEKSGMEEQYVTNVIEKGFYNPLSITYGRTFHYNSTFQQSKTKLLVLQQQILKEYARKENCIIVGRCADIILKELHPFNIFVYAEIESKIKRCRERMNKEETLSNEEIKRKIKQIDTDRKKYRYLFTDRKWGEKEGYHLCINTTGLVIKTIVPSVTKYCESWFRGKEK